MIFFSSVKHLRPAGPTQNKKEESQKRVLDPNPTVVDIPFLIL